MGMKNNANTPQYEFLPYSQSGGARIGSSFLLSYNPMSPFATLTIAQDEIEISAIGMKDIRLFRNDILSIQEHQGAFSIGLKIVHKKRNTAPLIIFWPSTGQKLTELKNVLQECGFFSV